jgi:hypothetical protein
MPSLRCLAFASVLAALLPSAAAAQPTVYTNRAAWENAVRAAGIPVTTIDFEGLAPVGGTMGFQTGLTQAGVTFIGSGPGRPNVTVSGRANAVFSPWGSGAKLLSGFGFGRSVSPAGSISLPQGVRALAFTYTASCSHYTSSPSCGSSPWSLRLDGGPSISIPGNPAPPGLAFAGVLSPSPIARIELDPTGSVTVMDDFWFGPGSSTPSQTDLSLTAAGTSLATAGAVVGFDLTLRNIGATQAPNAQIRVVLPSAFAFVPAGTDSRCSGSTIVICAIGTMPVSSVVPVRLNLRAVSVGRLNARFVASSSSAEAFTSDNVADVGVTVLPSPTPPPPTNHLVGTLLPGRPTIVLTHGWSPESQLEGALRGDSDLTWTGTGQGHAARLIADEFARTGRNVNVVQFVWPGAFTDSSLFSKDLTYGTAYSATLPAGIDLGRRLLDALGEDYAQDIQFVGHSLGSAVNANGAAYFLKRSTGRPRLRFTALDRPDRVWFGLPNFRDDFFVTLLHAAKVASPSPSPEVLIENYYSDTGISYGAPADGSTAVPAYNHVPLSHPSDIARTFFGEIDTNDHSGVQAWYRLTIQPDAVPGFDQRSYCNGSGWLPRPLFAVAWVLMSPTLNPCQRGWERSLFGTAGDLPGPYDTSYTPPAAAGPPALGNGATASAITAGFTASLALTEFVDFGGCSHSDVLATVSCAETPASLAQAGLAIPTDSAYLSFEYRFDASADGEHAVVMIDDVPVWTLSGTGATGVFELVTGLPIRGLSGARALTVAFYGAGATTGRFEIRNLTVTSGSPEHRYLAEGATGTFFDTKVALFNPHAQATNAVLRFARSDGTATNLAVPLGAHARATIDLKAVDGLADANMSTTIESGLPIVVDRRMSWDASGYGSHAERAVEAPSTVWYLAEGSTSGDFALFYLLQNPQAHAVDVVVRYLLPFGQAPIERTYSLRPNSRTTIPVDALGPPLDSTDVSAVITATAPIIVERAMYRSSPTQVFTAGHGSAGITNPSTEWFLAEGATGPFFDLFVLLANPHDTAATVRIDFLLSTGETFTKDYVVPANGRYTVWVDAEEIPPASGRHPLANVAVSVTARSTNGVPIIVERTMWWPGPEYGPDFWYEAHNSAGATATGTRWALADGETGGSDGAETYVLIANTSATPGVVRVRLFFDDGEVAERVIQVAARSRTNVNVSADFPEALGRRFGTLVESIGDTPAQIVVERAMYASPTGRTWASGTGSLATRLQ